MKPPKTSPTLSPDGVSPLSAVSASSPPRLVTGFADRHWGFDSTVGIPASSLTALTWSVGAGASTFFLQLLSAAARASKRKVLYVNADEESRSVRERALRLRLPNLKDILLLGLESQAKGYKLTRALLERYQPALIVIESVDAGDRVGIEVLENLKEHARSHGSRPILVGCRLRSNSALPRRIADTVDTVLKLDTADILCGTNGEEHFTPEAEPFRILKTLKNRHGDIYESYFTLTERGLRPYEIPTSPLHEHRHATKSTAKTTAKHAKKRA